MSEFSVNGMDLTPHVMSLDVSHIAPMPGWAELGDIPGLKRMGSVTLEGTWVGGLDIASGPDESVLTILFSPDQLPRRMKKRLRKMLDGRPLGRRERQWMQRRKFTIRDYEVRP